jgi:hypothetical protein
MANYHANVCLCDLDLDHSDQKSKSPPAEMETTTNQDHAAEVPSNEAEPYLFRSPSPLAPASPPELPASSDSDQADETSTQLKPAPSKYGTLFGDDEDDDLFFTPTKKPATKPGSSILESNAGSSLLEGDSDLFNKNTPSQPPKPTPQPSLTKTEVHPDKGPLFDDEDDELDWLK